MTGQKSVSDAALLGIDLGAENPQFYGAVGAAWMAGEAPVIRLGRFLRSLREHDVGIKRPSLLRLLQPLHREGGETPTASSDRLSESANASAGPTSPRRPSWGVRCGPAQPSPR